MILLLSEGIRTQSLSTAFWFVTSALVIHHRTLPRRSYHTNRYTRNRLHQIHGGGKLFDRMAPTLVRISNQRKRGPNGILVLFCVCLMCAFRSWQGFSPKTTTTSIVADAFVLVPSQVARSNGGDADTVGRAWEVTTTNGGSGIVVTEPPTRSFSPVLFALGGENDDDENADINKFDMAQRIESLKSVVLGALSGGIAVTPIAYLHYVVTAEVSNTAQWEFVTDMSSLQAALFAIVYRYAVRANDNNPMLNQGVVGAFVVVRTLADIHVTDTCQSIPLRCGPPLGYFDWNMIKQAAWGGVESAALFGAASLAMEFAFRQKWISKFD